MENLRGRGAVVTGAGSGIGRALAYRLAGEGVRSVLVDVEEKALEETVAGVDGEAYSVVADVSDAGAVRRVAEAAGELLGNVHVLVNNAGVNGTGGTLWETSPADWEWVLGVNLMGIVHGIQAFVPGMLAHGEEAHIVNTASMAGLVTFGGGGAYGASKHAAVTVSELLHLELRQRQARIGVSVLCPAWVRTRILDSERNLPERLRDGAGDGLDEGTYAAMTASMAATGLDADEVAADAVDAILNDRFYVLSNQEWTGAVGERAAAIRQGNPPAPPTPAPST